MTDRNQAEIRRTSKFLSLLLRHRPETIGLAIDRNGWADINELIAKANATYRDELDRELVEFIVATNPKQRFSISEDGSRIRANQGHSIDVDLDFMPIEPPVELFHGTAMTSLEAIRCEGLTRQNRQHVHLSADREAAATVGARHGQPVVLTIEAATMHAVGYEFFRSDNGVWLTDQVPATYFSTIDYPETGE